MSVLTVITRETGALPLARLGHRLARALEENLVVLCLEPVPLAPLRGDGKTESDPASVVPGDEIPEGASARVAEICAELARGTHTEELRARDDEAAEDTSGEARRVLPDPEIEVRWLTTSRRLQAVLDQARELGATYLIAAKHKPRSQQEPLARELFAAAPCHTILTRLGASEATSCERILVPTAGGPHAAVALRLGERLAGAVGGRVVPLYVGSGGGELAGEVATRILQRAITEAGVEGSRFVAPRVELADDHTEAIGKVAADGFDLLLIGDSNAGTLRRRLFGTVPEHLLTGDDGLQVAVVRREWKLLHRLRHRLGRWLDLTIPQMARAERIALYEKLQSGSEWNFDFMTLISLSTAIAALGLLQDSAAVVIGAMLVAPLMTPILGAGLALVQGNYPLLKISGRAIILGYLMAVLIGFAAGLVFPIRELTPQLLARGGPTLIDMGVGFLSGLAAAFCLGRPGLLAALPGVAIAAALVPPIATTGVCLALGEGVNARGAALLFATNVVAIILGAGVSLYASGVRGKSGAASHQRWVRYSFFALLLGTVALAVPLGSGLKSQLFANAALEIPATLEARLTERLGGDGDIRIATLAGRREDGERILEIELAAPQPASAELVRDLAGVAREELGADLVVHVGTRILAEVN